jgi:hypothetical protein
MTDVIIRGLAAKQLLDSDAVVQALAEMREEYRDKMEAQPMAAEGQIMDAKRMLYALNGLVSKLESYAQQGEQLKKEQEGKVRLLRA